MPTIMENCTANREAWLAARKGKIGASSAYHAANIDEGSNPLKPWLELRGEGENDYKEEVGTGWAYWGRKFEPILGEVFCELYVDRNPGAEVKIVSGDFLQQHPRHEFAIATPDFMVSINGELCNLQTKTRSPNRFSEYDNDSMPNEDRAQIIHEVGVLEEFGIKKAFLAAFFYPKVGSDYMEPQMDYRECYVEPAQAEEVFSREAKLVQLAKEGTVPDLKNMSSDQARALFWNAKTEVIDMIGNADFEEAVQIYMIHNEKEKAAAEMKKKMGIKMLEMIGTGRVADCKIAKVNVIRMEFDEIDTKKIKEENLTLNESLLKTYGKNRKSIYPRVYPKK